ncbi:unnamed protein product [Auanema sp. JU1783]|nr:unnamed protein product [Auanema sp. JU1783]
MMFSLIIIGSIISLVHLTAANYTSFVDVDTNQIGLTNDKGRICIALAFKVGVFNLNIKESNNFIPFDLLSDETIIGGRCSKDFKTDPILTAIIVHESRKRKLKFYFGTKNVYVKQIEELRWQLRKVVYTESYEDRSASFESDNSSVIISSPLNQKYICKDQVNITLHSEGFEDVIVSMSPDIDFQPYGPKSNAYLCERTRKRTLRESFENKATVFSGVVLGLASVGSIVGHSIRRHLHPVRKEIYQNLAGN